MDLATPKYDLKEFPNVYDPAEDTFLFIDALESEVKFLQDLKPLTVVEIGSGSGVVLTSLTFILKKSCIYFSTDINIEACHATQKTAELNNTNIETLNMNLLSNFKQKTFDIILFNPPYVLTEDSEVSGNGLNRAWAGGKLGRKILDELLVNLSDLLSDKGVCYLVLLKENKPTEIVDLLKKKNMSSDLIIERKIPGEHLFVYKFFKVLK